MADSVDRVFAHALSTVRKVPRTGSARPPPAERLRLYGLYKQSMEGDVEGVLARPVAMSTPEEKGEMDKWDAWHACAGLSRTEAKRRYITTLIRTMHTYASGTAEARALVEELEFVWEQVRGNYEAQMSASAAEEEERRRRSSSGREIIDESGLRVLRPLSENEVQAGAPGALDDPNAVVDGESFADARSYSSGSDRGRPPRYSRSPSPLPGMPPERDASPKAAAHWRRGVSRALVQLTAEVAALRELADGSSTSALGRYFARSRRRRRGLLLKVWSALWRVSQRILVDAAVVALVVVVLRWRWRTKVESAWELLGVWLGFVGDEVRGKLTERVREGIKMGGQSVTLLGGGGKRGEAGRGNGGGKGRGSSG